MPSIAVNLFDMNVFCSVLVDLICLQELLRPP